MMDAGEQTTGTRDEHYNLVSVLYHALQGADTCNVYALDAEAAGDERLAAFFREAGVVQTQLAERAKGLLGIGGGVAPGPGGVATPRTTEPETAVPPEGVVGPGGAPTDVRRGTEPELPPPGTGRAPSREESVAGDVPLPRTEERPSGTEGTTPPRTEDVSPSEQRGGGYDEILERYSEYEVYDRDGDKIGKVDELFLDENDQPEYIGVKMGFLGLEGTGLIPWEAARVNEGERRIEVSADKETVKNGPSYGDDDEITPEYEERILRHYGLGGGWQGTGQQTGAYGDYYSERNEEFTSSAAAAGVAGGERPEAEAQGQEARDERPLAGERDRERGLDHEREGLGARARGTDEDEVRVQRTEEELRAGTREREAGALKVRKRVRTEREQISVPTRHEEVSVERVPVEEGREASEAEIGEDEVVMPVTEEEVVVEKRPVVKEEIRVRKDVVEDEEVVEEDVRREEVDVEDQTERGGGRLERDTDLGDEETRRRGR
jgi:uncharacterized protein (TIGR02271 family)